MVRKGNPSGECQSKSRRRFRLWRKRPFEPEEFPFAFLEAFSNKGDDAQAPPQGRIGNKSDLGGVLWTNNIHIAGSLPPAKVTNTLAALEGEPGDDQVEGYEVCSCDWTEKVVRKPRTSAARDCRCRYADFPDHFGFFLPLAGITTVRQIRENAFDIKATGRLNRLYLELLKENPDWDAATRRPGHESLHGAADLLLLR